MVLEFVRLSERSLCHSQGLQGMGRTGGEIVEEVDLVAPVLEAAAQCVLAARPGDSISEMECVANTGLVIVRRDSAKCRIDVIREKQWNTREDRTIEARHSDLA